MQQLNKFRKDETVTINVLSVMGQLVPLKH